MTTPKTPKSVAVIITSVRGKRVGPQVADFVNKTIAKDAEANSVSLHTVDLVDFNLPVYNEDPAPATIFDRSKYKYETTKAWSAEIAKYDAYVLVIQEYNYGVAGATKNAIDYLVNEWKGKPATIISYGIGGGNTANDQVSYVLEKMGLRVTATRPQLPFAGAVGPDLFLAMNEGKLADGTRESWEKEKAADVVKAFTELREELDKVEGTQPLAEDAKKE